MSQALVSIERRENMAWARRPRGFPSAETRARPPVPLAERRCERGTKPSKANQNRTGASEIGFLHPNPPRAGAKRSQIRGSRVVGCGLQVGSSKLDVGRWYLPHCRLPTAHYSPQGGTWNPGTRSEVIRGVILT
jgi:hypothetical protein